MNAVLRRVATSPIANRQSPIVEPNLPPAGSSRLTIGESRLATLYSHPEWLVARWVQRFGAEETERLLRANNRRPELVIQPARWSEVVTAEGGSVVGEEYFPMDHLDYGAVVADIMATEADVVFNTIVPPGLTPFLDELYRAGFQERGGTVVCTYFDDWP